MTLTDDRVIAPTPLPAVSSRPRTKLATSRFAARLAWREVKRRKGRTALVALMIAVPVMAMTFGSLVMRSENDPAGSYRLNYGNTDLADEVYFGESSVEWPSGGEISIVSHAGTDIALASEIAGETPWVTLVLDDAQPALAVNPIALARLDIVEGSWPERQEALIPVELAESADLAVGDELNLSIPSGKWRVAGIVRDRSGLWSAPLVLAGVDSSQVIVELTSRVEAYAAPDGTSVDQIGAWSNELGASTWTQPEDWVVDDQRAALGWGFVMGVVALALTGIIVAAAFATSGRRQLVTVGQLSANGADPRVVRRSLAMQGTWSGIIGAIGGVVGGVIVRWALSPLLARMVNQELLPVRYVWIDFVVISIVAVIAATVAAAVPSRSIATTPTLTALAGRRPQGAPPRRLVPIGFGLSIGGLALAMLAVGSMSGGSGGSEYALAATVGIVAFVFGGICATPFIVEQIGRLGRHVPLSPRLALRSMARARSRSAAVVAAIAVAVGAGVAVGAIAEHEIVSNGDDAYYQEWLATAAPPDTVIVVADPTSANTPNLLDQLNTSVTNRFPEAMMTPLKQVTADPDLEAMELEYVADEALVRTIGLSEVDLATLEREGRLRLNDSGLPYETRWGTPVDGTVPDRAALDEFESLPAPDSSSTQVASTPEPTRYRWFLDHVLVTPEQAARDGLAIGPGGTLVRIPQASEADRFAVNELVEQIDPSRVDAADYYYAFVGLGDPLDATASIDPDRGSTDVGYLSSSSEPNQSIDTAGRDLWIARGVVVLIVLLFVGFVAAVGLVLGAVEGRDEYQTMVAIGAGPKSLRRQSVARATTIVLAGTALGVPAGYLCAWSIWHAGVSVYSTDLRFPWFLALGLTVVVPGVVATGAWLTSSITTRRRPSIQPR